MIKGKGNKEQKKKEGGREGRETGEEEGNREALDASGYELSTAKFSCV